ncbi:MAG: feruloyl-CoA synthase [Devosia sp.]
MTALTRGDIIRRFEGFAPQRAVAETRQDGTVLVRSVAPLGPAVRLTTDWLQHWAGAAPDRTFLAERSGAGWRRMSFRETLEQVRAVAAGLVGRGLSAERPIAILSGNSIDHALLLLAAQYVGVPTASLAEQYSLVPEARGRLTEILEILTPGLVYVSDRERFADALTARPLQGVEIVASAASRGATPLDQLAKAATSGLEAAHATVTPDSLAKIIFTSGSISAPKGVMTTQRMLCVNQAQIRQVWPFLGDHPPQLVDWLPWNHVFGGSHNINMMLANGGTLYIDDGKPTAGGFGRTIENLKLVGHTISFNVPTTFALLVEHMEKDEALRAAYFRGLDLIFYAGASLPQHLWEKLETMAMATNGYAPLMSSGWGMTETAPTGTMVHSPIDRAGELGAPLPGVTAKLIPGEDGRCELRVKGPNVMPGYFRDPTRTAESFDEEGYLITGDAVRLIDPADPSRGMFYEGRVAEDFKLMTGTWVQVSKLRVGALPDLSPLVADLVIAGHDSDQVGALAFPNLAGMRALGIVAEEDNGALAGPALKAALLERLTALARKATGSSNRITRILVLAEPPSIEHGETTDKGTLNQRRVLTHRANLVARLEDEGDKAVVRLGKEQS